MGTTISTGHQDTIPEYAALLADTFAHDDITRSFFGPETEPAVAKKHLQHQFEALMRAYVMDCGVIDVARNDDGQLLGVALWLKPNPKPHIINQLKEIPTWWKTLPSLKSLPRIIRMSRIFNDAKPKQDHWFLADIAVSSAARGQGVGGALLEHRLHIIDQNPTLAYLEATTEAASKLYARHGFQHRETLDVDGTPCFTMVRLPHKRPNM